jgi:hypothetical protein
MMLDDDIEEAAYRAKRLAEARAERDARAAASGGRYYEWRTTVPSGRAHTHGADDGQTGWRLHLVDETDMLPSDTGRNYRAVCGTRAIHGWGLDLFISDTCSKCEAKIEKKGITPPKIPN